MNTLEKIKFDLKNSLSKERYEHSLRVADEAKRLAKYYNTSEESAYIAGLLHDIAKEYNKEENERIVSKYNLDKSLLDDLNKRISHAEIGAVIALEKYKVDEDVADAIRYHTIGNIKMNLLAKIIFVADKIEPLKKYIGIEEERRLAYINIDLALIECLKNTELKLANEGKTLNIETKKLLEYLNINNL